MEMIQQLRSQTGAGILDVKKALDEAGSDYDKALELLRKRGQQVAAKKAGREASEGIIASYVHMHKIGVIVELNCETDFVARTEDFQQLGKDLAMQVASMNPLYVATDDVPHELLEKEREIYGEQIEAGTAADVREKIIEGKLKKYLNDVCLLNQLYFKDQDKTIQDLLTEAIGKLGENIQVKRFARFSLDDADKTHVCVNC
jgi:elongation factor Ts